MKNRTLAILLLGVALFLPLSDLLMSQGQENAQWTLVVERGFEDRSNTVVVSHVIFEDYLYVGTFKASSGAEIWRTRDGVAWGQVGLDGLGNPRNHGMKVFTFRDKLYVGTLNYDEGMELWVSSDGEKFDRIASRGFGEKSMADTPYQVTFNDLLIIPGYWPGPSPMRGMEIWASKDGIEFKKVVENGLGDEGNWIPFLKPVVFHDQLYIGTENSKTGGEVWRTADGVYWERVIDKGMDNPLNLALSPNIVFNDQLYVASVNLNGFQLFRTSDGENWEKVITNGLRYKEDYSRGGWIYESEGKLYLIAHGSSKGFQLWSSQNGKDWTQLGKSGFGKSSNYAAGLDIIDDKFYISTLNSVDGCEVWRSKDKTDWERIFKENKARPDLVGGGTIEFNNYLLLLIYDSKDGFDIWRYGPIRLEEKTTTSATTTLTSTTTETSLQPTTTEIAVGPKAADYTSIIIVAGIAAAAVIAITLILVLRHRRPPPVEVKALRCPNCGAQLSSDAEYCMECGAKRKG